MSVTFCNNDTTVITFPLILKETKRQMSRSFLDALNIHVTEGTDDILWLLFETPFYYILKSLVVYKEFNSIPLDAGMTSTYIS